MHRVTDLSQVKLTAHEALRYIMEDYPPTEYHYFFAFDMKERHLLVSVFKPNPRLDQMCVRFHLHKPPPPPADSPPRGSSPTATPGTSER